MSDTHAPAAPLPPGVAGFTAHNIELPDGRQTAPEHELLAATSQLQGMLRSASALMPVTDPDTPPRVVDLGCLEGGYSVEFARHGYDALGIEARQQSFNRCEFVRRELGLANLRFAHDDVRNVAAYGPFEITFCCGLLYHMEDPAAFLELIASVTTRLLILHTHYATIEPQTEYPLGPLTTHEGLLGRWYQEFPPSMSKEVMEQQLWASWGNPVSFWPERKHLLQAIHKAGFPLVYEQFDWLGDIVSATYVEQHSRSLFIGVKV